MLNTKLKYCFFCILVSLSFGCAPAKWAPIKGEPVELTWPPPPAFAKVRYLHEILGFREEGESLSTVLFGRSESGRIVKPVAVAVGPDGRIAVADQHRRGVHLYIPSTGNYRFLFQAGDQVMQTPVGVTFSSDNMLFITDSSLRKVLKYKEDTSFAGTIDSTEDTPLLRPSGIVCDCKTRRLHVTDTLQHQVLVYNRHGTLLERIGTRGAEKGQLNFPTHVAMDRQGSMYVTDALNFRAQIYSPALRKWQMFGRHGNGSGDFASPKGIAVDTANTIYIAETLFDTVQLFDRDGTYLLNIGSKGNGPGQFWMPSGIHIDKRDRLYVCDTYNQRIQVFQLVVDENKLEARIPKYETN